MPTEPKNKKKSIAVAYALWFFFGLFGVHKFYVKRPYRGMTFVMAWVYVIAMVMGYALARGINVVVFVTFHLMILRLIVNVILWIIDAFTLPHQVRKANEPIALTPKQIRRKKISKIIAIAEIAIVLVANLFFSNVGHVTRMQDQTSPTSTQAQPQPRPKAPARASGIQK